MMTPQWMLALALLGAVIGYIWPERLRFDPRDPCAASASPPEESLQAYIDRCAAGIDITAP